MKNPSGACERTNLQSNYIAVRFPVIAPPAKTLPREPVAVARELAFSLIELLVVIAIIGLMMVLIVPAFNNFGKAQLLNAEGNKIASLINLAGQNSAAKNAMTALVAIPGDSSRPGSFGLFEYLPESVAWKQISKWESLKTGIAAEFTNATYGFTEYPGVKPNPDFSAISFRGANIPEFKYLVFLPSRSLFQNNSAEFQLVEGFHASGTNITYTRKGSASSPANYYRLTVLGTTGRAKIDRP